MTAPGGFPFHQQVEALQGHVARMRTELARATSDATAALTEMATASRTASAAEAELAALRATKTFRLTQRPRQVYERWRNRLGLNR